MIGITMGCPVGIGPEILLKFFASLPDAGGMRPVIIGDLKVILHTSSVLDIPAEIVSWQPGDKVEDRTVPVYNLSSLDISTLRWGVPDAVTGKAMATFIEGGQAYWRWRPGWYGDLPDNEKRLEYGRVYLSRPYGDVGKSDRCRELPDDVGWP